MKRQIFLLVLAALGLKVFVLHSCASPPSQSQQQNLGERTTSHGTNSGLPQARLTKANEPINGQMTANSRTDQRTQTPYNLYRYEGTPGERVQIDLMSDDFDAVLAVANSPIVTRYCRGCRYDDDGGEGTNSRLRLTLPSSGTLYIQSGAMEPTLGSYTLQVRQLPALRPASPQPLKIGEVVVQTFDEETPVDQDEQPYAFWALRGQPHQPLIVRMRSEDFDTFLEFGQYTNGVFMQISENDDFGKGTNSRLEVALNEQGRGMLRAKSLGDFGRYTLVASPPAAQKPLRIKDLPVGRTTLGQLSLASDFLEDDDSHVNAYRIQGQPGERFTIIMESGDFDAFLRWGYIMENQEFYELAHDDDSGGGSNARLTVTLGRDSKDVLLATSYPSGSFGRYRITVVLPPTR